MLSDAIYNLLLTDSKGERFTFLPKFFKLEMKPADALCDSILETRSPLC